MKRRKMMYGFSLILIVIGISLEPSMSLFKNLALIIIGKDGLITDYFIKASYGSTFVNAGLVGLAATMLLHLNKAKFSGLEIAAIGINMGFAFFGKNIVNIWPIILGGYIFSSYNKVDFLSVLPATLFATSFAPLSSEIIFMFEGNMFMKIIIAAILSISVGYVINLIAPHVTSMHKGFSLYNIGLAIGIIATVYVSVLKTFGFTIESQLLWDNNLNTNLYFIFLTLFICTAVYALTKPNVLINYKQLLNNKTKSVDYGEQFGFAAMLLNMATLGIFTLAITYALEIPLNGPICGGLITIIAFGSYGKTIKNIAPIFIAVIIGNIFNLWTTTNPSVAITMMFLTGLAPITDTFGFIPAIIVAMINVTVGLNTGVLHGGLNLYNTGFSIGITCTFIVPIYEQLFKHKLND